ncbi:MAG: hypothetical protein R6X06_04060 [Gammaproteobacteria bacterium]
MKGIYLDPEATVIGEQFAVVKAGRRKRERVPESVVEVVASQALALERARPEQQLLAARVLGPSRSSEGLRVYYIIEWLHPPA